MDSQLSYEEAKSVASVFGEVDYQKTILLLMFREPASKYDCLKKMGDLLEDFSDYRVPRATLYRKVDELFESSFLEITGKRKFVRGSLAQTVYKYTLSFKGYAATIIYSYAFLLDPNVPKRLKKDILPKGILEAMESSMGRIFVMLLKWHKERSIDLSRAKVGILYFNLTLVLSIMDHPQDISREIDLVATYVEPFSALLGLSSRVNVKEFFEEVQILKKEAQDIEDNFLARFRKFLYSFEKEVRT